MSKIVPFKYWRKTIFDNNISIGFQWRKFFTKLLSTDVPTTKDELGAYFIDRNGELFEPILYYLRTGELPSSFNGSWIDVLRESEYFAIDPIIPFVKEKLTISELAQITFDSKIKQNNEMNTIFHSIIEKVFQASASGDYGMTINLISNYSILQINTLTCPRKIDYNDFGVFFQNNISKISNEFITKINAIRVDITDELLNNC